MPGSKKITNLNLVKDSKKKTDSKVSALSPREIVSELDRYVIGQKEAKKAVAVALRVLDAILGVNDIGLPIAMRILSSYLLVMLGML